MEQYERFEITWPQLKKKYYGQNIIVQYGRDFIDFSRDTVNLDDFNGPDAAYSRLLDIQADPSCIVYPHVQEIFYRDDVPDQVIVDGEVQGFDQEYRMMMISPAHFLYYVRPDDQRSLTYGCTEYGFSIPLEEFDGLKESDVSNFVKGDHILLSGSLVRTVVSDDDGPSFLVFTVNHIIFAANSTDPVLTEAEYKAKGLICFFCPQQKNCLKMGRCLLDNEKSRELEKTIAGIMESLPCPLPDDLKKKKNNVKKAQASLHEALPDSDKPGRLLS